MKSQFENFLQEWHAKDYHGTDDDMPDAFESWISDLDVSSFIELADIAILEGEMRGIERAKELALQTIKDTYESS